MSVSYAPIVVFAYNRVDKLENCLECLERCPEASLSELYLFCDGYKSDNDRDDVLKVHEYANDYYDRSAFLKTHVNIREENAGLAASIISGVTQVISGSGKVIVVEDDLKVLPSFLKFLNEGLEYYANDLRCGSISAFTYPMKCLDHYNSNVYATRKAECWGWATWANRWNEAEWKDIDFLTYFKDLKCRLRFEQLEAGIERLMYLQYKGQIDSWAVRWIYYLFKKGQLTVYPTKSRVINDGFDGSGTHFVKDTGKIIDSGNLEYESEKNTGWEKCELNEQLAKEYAKYPRGFFPVYFLETLGYLIKGLLV